MPSNVSEQIDTLLECNLKLGQCQGMIDTATTAYQLAAAEYPECEDFAIHLGQRLIARGIELRTEVKEGLGK